MTVPPTQSSSPTATTFDAALASSLFPSIVALSHAAALLHASGEGGATTNDQAIASAKLDLGRQATQLRNALATLKSQAERLEMGELSIDDQAWLIEQLQQRAKDKKAEVEQLRDLIPEPDQSSHIGPSTAAVTTSDKGEGEEGMDTSS